jgi:hypothetical protein
LALSSQRSCLAWCRPSWRAWLQWLPIQVDLLFLPGSEIAMLMLAMLVLSAQYLLIFFLVLPVRPLVRRLGKLLIRPLRSGLVAH